MTNATSAFRGLLVYGLVLPLALVVGYLMATPTDIASAGTIGLVLLAICAPLFLKWHYPVLILSWGMGATIFFLPGSPSLWMCMAFTSLLIALVQRALDKQIRFISEPSLFWPIAFLALVVMVTAKATGGFGMRVFGASMIGGRRYLLMFAAIGAYFAMASQRIPREKALLYVGLFFLGSTVNTISTLIPYGPRELYFLAWIFPVGGTDITPLANSTAGFSGFNEMITRFFGLTLTCLGWCCYLLARYGIQNMLSGAKIWRFAVFSIVLILGAAGGFRSFLLTVMLTFALVFFFEGLLRTRYAGAVLLVVVLAAALAVPFAKHLPLSIQRSLSTLPLEIDPVARYDAEASSEWRLKMWSIVLPEVPRYFWFGKGLSIDAQELSLTSELGRRYLVSTQEASMLAGDYHNGPLTVLIPFGIWGLIAWIWFLVAGARALYLNHRFGDPSLKTINTLLLSFFLARAIVFVFIFGNFYTDLAEFIGLVGLGISLNHGISRAPVPARVASDDASELEEIEATGEPVIAVSRI